MTPATVSPTARASVEFFFAATAAPAPQAWTVCAHPGPCRCNR